MLCFLVTAADRLVAGVGASSDRTGLMEFGLGRVSDTWDVPVLSVETRNITTQHLFQVEMSILKKKNTDMSQKKAEPLVQV